MPLLESPPLVVWNVSAVELEDLIRVHDTAQIPLAAGHLDHGAGLVLQPTVLDHTRLQLRESGLVGGRGSPQTGDASRLRGRHRVLESGLGRKHFRRPHGSGAPAVAAEDHRLGGSEEVTVVRILRLERRDLVQHQQVLWRVEDVVVEAAADVLAEAAGVQKSERSEVAIRVREAAREVGLQIVDVGASLRGRAERRCGERNEEPLIARSGLAKSKLAGAA